MLSRILGFALASAASPALAQSVDHGAMDHEAMGHAPAAPHPDVTPGLTQTTPDPHAQHRVHEAAGTPEEPSDHAPITDHSGHDMRTGHGDMPMMTGALGPYPMQRESSGTAWQPDTSEHHGLMGHRGDWMLMGHGVLNLVTDHQGRDRGDDKAFASGMLMGMAQRPVGNGTLQFRAMVSPDPLMGKRGYPLLLASGETADGLEHLVDRQHPHDFFMELSASLSRNIGPTSSMFLYGGLPGEPAFGPPAFMHREAIMDSPEAPISHHWLDSTHITFGVLTLGVVTNRVKLEVSRFNAREPDQHRWNIETGPLDSTAARLSWNPTNSLSLQGSWGKFRSPEQLEPGVDQRRWSASALYAKGIGSGWKLASTLAWGRKTIAEHDHVFRDDAVVAEASLKKNDWTLFSRGELTENRELIEVAGDHGPAYRVGKVSVGAVRDFRISEHISVGAGGLLALNFVPRALEEDYGSRNPMGTMAFIRLRVE
ncbi:hypothetical protein [Sphingomonas piscis]|uniref:hypothetical protein n=1 Tax=Sphingomonas piscis TaxID=2714943 RepID=UPI0019D09F30|nr:hypothetical protein [Sphingomonas piscis]